MRHAARHLSRRDFNAIGASAALGPALARAADAPVPAPQTNLPAPDWIHAVTRMAYGGWADIEPAGRAGVQVFHTNLVWPYFPLKKDGGGLSADDARNLKKLVDLCHAAGMRISLGLPPFPSVAHVAKHPDWRIHHDDSGAVLKLEPREDNLGTRNPCNLGPWGNYLIEVCAELTRDFGIDGFSFDGNYHPAICYCPSCKTAYKKERDRDIPAKANLDDVHYREYLVWRGEKLTDHYTRLRLRIRAVNKDAALMTWTVNAGRYGHFLHSPRAMPTSLNRVFDLPMQEWWLDETNLGASVAPAFGAAYLRATTGDNPAAAEAYLMSRGNPYGTDSFPAHERLTRCLLAVANGCVNAESFGWSGHRESTAMALGEVARRSNWMTRATPVKWGAMLVSEQTRQFYAYRDIADRFLPHVFGAFRMAMEEHLPVSLVNDWDITPENLAKYAVILLPNAAALSKAQCDALREYVKAGGGLVATGETSLCDDLGRPRGDFALADVFGARYEGRPKSPITRPKLDENFAITVDDNYWKQRIGIARFTWTDHAIFDDAKLRALVPHKAVTFKGPQVAVSVADPKEIAAKMLPEGSKPEAALPAMIARTFGRGRVVYFPAAIDAALWSYAYPYQRRLLARAVQWAANAPPPIEVDAPMCVQVNALTREGGKQLVVHLFNGLNTTANHGLPAMDVPLREETVAVPGIRLRLRGMKYEKFRVQPGDLPVKMTAKDGMMEIEVPPLEIHAMVVGE